MNVEAGRNTCLIGSAAHLSNTPAAEGKGGVRSSATANNPFTFLLEQLESYTTD